MRRGEERGRQIIKRLSLARHRVPQPRTQHCQGQGSASRRRCARGWRDCGFDPKPQELFQTSGGVEWVTPNSPSRWNLHSILQALKSRIWDF